MLKIFIFVFIAIIFISLTKNADAIVNPLDTANNKFGVHILFPSELGEAAKLVNSNGGDWGYVTIPIQVSDKNVEKWQKFMDDAKKNQLIPIIRMASENYFFDTKVWRKPDDFDILDFANFLNSLNWPTINKYIVVFNEVNRSDEWQGSTNPKEYAQILNYTLEAFKSLDKDFFIISAGLDNASANVFDTSINQYDFMREMDREIPGIFGKIDGLGSHSYPNPAFAQPPWVETTKSISSFKFERNLAEKLGEKILPVFITETGWSKEAVSESLIGFYVKKAFENVWSDDNIVAVTPFLLHAGAGPFTPFALLDSSGNPTPSYVAIEGISKIKGTPALEMEEKDSVNLTLNEKLPQKSFKKENQYDDNSVSINKAKIATLFLKWFFKSLNVL